MPPELNSTQKMGSKKKITFFAIGGGIGLAGVLWWRHNKSTSAASTATTADTANTGIDPTTGIPYADEGIDPTTGVPYADEYGGTPGEEGTYNPLTGQYTPGYGTTTQSSVPASNSNWATAAEATLVGDNYDAAASAAALGLYLAGQPLTQDQYDMVQAALGLEGPTPTSVPTPILAGGGGTGQVSGNPPGTVTPPPPAGIPAIQSLIGQTLYNANQVTSALGINNLVYVQGNPTPLAGPQASAPYLNSPVISAKPAGPGLPNTVLYTVAPLS
jgi:hypothetical protein